MRRAKDLVYADRVYVEQLPVQEVLAARTWRPRGAEACDCSYANVRLGDGAARIPPSWRDEEQGGRCDFGGAWNALPEPDPGDKTRRALQICAQPWPQIAPEPEPQTPGHRYDRDLVGETLYLSCAKAVWRHASAWEIDMTIKRIWSGSPFEEKIGYCRAVVAGGFVHVAGTVGQGNTVEEQCRSALAIISAAPSTSTEPLCGATSPAVKLSNVVLPEPLAPTRPAQPGPRSHETSRNTGAAEV